MASGTVVARAFTQALRNEMQAMNAARRAAAERTASSASEQETMKANTSTGMSLNEAMEILNVKDTNDVEAVRKSYNHLFEVNNKANGGSFYIQSKVVRAKERIEMELKNEEPISKENEEPISKDTTKSDV